MVAQHHGRKLDPHYLGYFDCFNRRQFYEAHEVLENLWLNDKHGPNGPFYKGLIQLAGAFVHLQRDHLRPVRPFVCLIYLFAGCNLSWLQKGFDEFAFAANGQAGKFLEPFAFRHFGVGAQPVRQKLELAAEMFRSLTRSSKWSRRRGGRFCRRIRGMCIRRKIRDGFLPAIVLISAGSLESSHSLGQSGQFFAGQLALARQFKGKLEHARLFRARQMFDFFDDGCGGHGKTIARCLDSSKGKLPQSSIPK